MQNHPANSSAASRQRPQNPDKAGIDGAGIEGAGIGAQPASSPLPQLPKVTAMKIPELPKVSLYADAPGAAQRPAAGRGTKRPGSKGAAVKVKASPDRGPAGTSPDNGRKNQTTGPSAARPGGHTGGQAPAMPGAVHRSNDQARRMLKRLVQGETPPTAPMSIVERLVGSPYANPIIQVDGVDTSARKTLDFALDMAETMFRYGAGALEVETSIIAVTAALGLRHIDVDITNQSVVLNYAKKDTTPITLVRVVRSWTDNYAGLSMVHRLVTDIVRGGVTRQEAIDRLAEITRRPKPFPRWMVTAATGIWGAAITAIIGGGFIACVVAFFVIIGAGLVEAKLLHWRLPSFFATAASAAMITFVALFLWWLSQHLTPWLTVTPGLVIAGGIVLMLPSGRLVSAVQDGINGFPVTAAGRMLSSLLTFAALVAGIGIGVVVGALLGLQRLDVTEKGTGSYNIVVLSVLVIIAGAAIGVIEQTSLNMLLPTGLVALLGFYVFTAVQFGGVGTRLAPAIAATAIGLAARMVALKMGSPQLVVAVPAVLYLLPGLMIFRAMYTLSMESASSVEGMVGLLNALTVVLAVAGGVVLGDNLAQPFTKGWGSNERRRRVRRR